MPSEITKEVILILLAGMLFMIWCGLQDLNTTIKEKQIILKIDTFTYDIAANSGSYIMLPKETK